MRFRVSRKLQENRIEIRLDQIRISFCFTVGFYFDRFYRRTRASATNAVGDLLPRSKQFARFFFSVRNLCARNEGGSQTKALLGQIELK